VNTSSYRIACHADPAALNPAWAALAREGRATPFQSAVFLRAWYAVLGARPHITTAIVEVLRAADDTPVLLLPLAVERRGGLRVLGFADCGVADNNAPVLGPACPEGAAFKALWRDILKVLPPADLLRFEKQPERIGARPNPLLALGPTRASALSAHPLTMPDSFEDYSRSRTTKFRKEQERVWRVFTRHAGARFDLIDDPALAAPILADMDRQQSGRMKELGIDSLLEQDGYTALYHRLVADGLATGDVVLGALTAAGETVGALLGISDGLTVTFVRIGHAGGEWATCSPGRLVIERMMMALHERGLRRFDFSIGDYGYKENFNIGTEPLIDLAMPLSWRAWPSIAMGRARAALRRSPLARRLRDSLKAKQPLQSLARST
jgi:CelD/BcsL family acetyltransferase involved in cellulose biosynthesis